MSQIFNFVNSSGLGSCSGINMRAACEQGAQFQTVIYIFDGCSDLPIDLTGCTVDMQVRATPESADIILEISTVIGNAVIDSLAGTITIVVPADVTADLDPGLFVYNLDLTESGGGITRLLEGNFEVQAGVIR